MGMRMALGTKMRIIEIIKNFYMQIFVRRSLRGELILLFLVVLMTPLVGVSLLVLNQMQGALREQMANKLIAVRQLKALQVEEYFQTVNRDTALAAGLPTTVSAVEEFGSGHDIFSVRRLGYLGNPDLVQSNKGDPYDVVHARYFNFFKNIIAAKGYDDIYLIAPNGDVVYNYDKGNDFATNLVTGPYRNTVLADLFRDLQNSTESDTVKISDFVIYGPSGGAPAIFAGAPIIKDGKNTGVLIYQLPVDQVSGVLRDLTGMGETGETYLVGADKLMRSNSRFQEDSTILKQEVNTVAVQNALADRSGVAEMDGYRGVTTLSAYQPLKIGNLKWALIAEVDPNEFFAPANQVRNVVLVVIVLASLFVAGLGFVVSNYIQDKRELYRFWFEASPDPVITYDTDGKVTNANSAFETTFGWTLKEIIGRWLDFVPEESRHTVKGLVETLYRDGKVVAAGDAKRLTKDGRVLDVQLSAALIKNNSGQTTGNISIFRDVTLQKQMEKRIAERTRDLNIASNVARQITQVLDMDELLHLMVDQMKEGFNLYAASVYLYHPETKELLLEATTDEEERQMKKAVLAISLEARPSVVAQTAREQKMVVINDVSQSDIYLLDPSLPNGKSEAVFPMVVGTHLIGVLDLLSEKMDRFSETDIQILNTLAEQIGIAVRNVQLYSVQVQAAAELRRADEMKTQFHSSVSHELRTPLNAIINYVDMVMGGLAGPVSEEQKELLNHSLQSSKHLLNLINDILDISKIQSGKMTLFVEDHVDMYEILDSAIGDAATMLKNKPVKFALDIDRGLPTLSCDKRRIRQILLNLLSNANKFTEEGTVTLSAKNKGDHILFSVSDTGAGIPSELQHIIFEPYVQSLDGVKKEQGTGLGLPISRSFAQAHGGRLWVESVAGKGSIFFFSLPIRNDEEKKS
jgi:PAS domain S-box-containing protein